MRPWLPVCALLALGCASTPPPTDAGTDTPAPLDGGTDAAPPEDRPAALDVVAVDTPDVNQTEIAPMVDVVDAGGGEDAPDAVAVADVPALDAPDVVTADTPDVAVAVADVVDVVQLADGVSDAPTDAPRDTGPADAGPVLYDLNQARGALEVRAIYSDVGSSVGTRCDVVAAVASCRVESGVLRFGAEACGRSFSGEVPLATTTGRVVSVSSTQPAYDYSPVVVVGAAQAGRQSIRLGVAAPRPSTGAGVAGVPGRTVDAARGDVWLLGCEVR
jgi:hypothetical protein